MFKFPGFPASSIFSSVLIVLAAAFMAVEGIWGIGLFHHWSFLTVVFLILLSLSFAAVKDFERKSWCRLTGHTGLALVLFAGLFGTTDCTDVQLRLFSGGPQEHMAFDAGGEKPCPIS